MKATLLSPRNEVEGRYSEKIAMVAARRCRTTKSLEELQDEVLGYSKEKVLPNLMEVILKA